MFTPRREGAMVVWVLALVGCDGGPVPEVPPLPDATDSGGTPVDTATPADTSADTATEPIPPGLTATCAPTANALRFDCAVTVDPPQPVEIRFAPADGSAPERVHRSDLVAAEHDIGLYLMRPETPYVWTASALEPGGAEVVGLVVTPVLPPEVVGATLTVSGTSSVRYIGTHQPCDATATAVVFDTVTGEIVWYHSLDDNGTIGFFDMVQFTEDHTVLAETGPSLVEVDLRGRDLLRLRRNVDYPHYFHHDLFKRDGYVYAIFMDGGAPTLDGVAIFDATTGGQVAEWRARDHLDIPPGSVGDWMHTNTVWVDELGDIFLSSWAQDTVLKIEGDWNDPAFGAQLWALAGLGGGGFGHDFLVDYSPVVSAGFFDQHNVNFTADGRLLMLDNAHGRGLLMTVDQKLFTARADAEFRASVTSCGPQGTAQSVTAGNVFVGCSGDDVIEYDLAGTQVWAGAATCLEGRPSVIRWYPLEGW